VNSKKLGILPALPPQRGNDRRASLPFAPAEARELRRAFLEDLLSRLSKLKKVSVTVFHDEEDSDMVMDAIRRGFPPVQQASSPSGDRIEGALSRLLAGAGQLACAIGGESPDLPLVYVKRAYVKLKHKDVVLGPTLDGGCYLIGLNKQVPGLFEGLSWDETDLLALALERVERARLSCALLPPWYAVHAPESLPFLETMMRARRLEKRDRLHAVEKALETIRKTGDKREKGDTKTCSSRSKT
jgi:hypothetical protein